MNKPPFVMLRHEASLLKPQTALGDDRGVCTYFGPIALMYKYQTWDAEIFQR